MALVFCESFDHGPRIMLYDGEKWTNGSSSILLESGGRTGSCMVLRSSGDRLTKNDLPDRNDSIIGFAYKGGGTITPERFFSFDNQIAFDTYQAHPDQGITLYASQNTEDTTKRDLTIRRADLNTDITVLAQALNFNSGWDYIELRASSLQDGPLQVRINGELVFDGTNPQASSVYGRAILMGFGSSGGVEPFNRFDDFYITDITDGSTFLGQARIECLHPVSDGDLSEWVNDEGNSTDNWEKVSYPGQQVTLNTWVKAEIADNRDLYNYGDLAIAATSSAIAGIQLVSSSQLFTAGLNIAHLVRLGGVDILGPNRSLTVGSIYKDKTTTFDTKPGGGVWTKEDVNNAQFGAQSRA